MNTSAPPRSPLLGPSTPPPAAGVLTLFLESGLEVPGAASSGKSHPLGGSRQPQAMTNTEHEMNAGSLP